MTQAQSEVQSDSSAVAEVFPLLWSADVDRIVDWTITTLGLRESWRAPGASGAEHGSEHGSEHAEVLWLTGRVGVNIKQEQYAQMGPSGISLRVDDRRTVDAIHARAKAAGADFVRDLEETQVAYGFTVRDPDGNQWWVNAETGFLDQLRVDAAKGT